MIERCLIVDTETNDLDVTKGERLEVAAVLFSLRAVTPLMHFATILPASGNPPEVERINRILPAALKEMGELFIVEVEAVSPAEPMMKATHAVLESMLAAADVVVAYNAEFDRPWWGGAFRSKTWLCAMADFEWSKATRERSSLVHLAIDHDVPVGTVHRALGDRILLAGILGKYDPESLQRMFTRAMRPAGVFQSLQPFAENDKAKAAGFRWDGEKKIWTRRLAIEDAAGLPFKVRRLDG